MDGRIGNEQEGWVVVGSGGRIGNEQEGSFAVGSGWRIGNEQEGRGVIGSGKRLGNEQGGSFALERSCLRVWYGFSCTEYTIIILENLQ